MKRIVLVACLALSFALPSSFAQSAAPVDPDSAAAVKELLVAMNYRESMRQTIAQVQSNLPSMMLQATENIIKNNQAMTQAQKQAALEKAKLDIPLAVGSLNSAFSDPALMDEIAAEMVPLYARHFSAAEIRQLAAFYRTPVGAKMVAAMPQIAGESLQISQKVILPRISAAVQKVVKP
jgi:hypothetical protein